MFLDRLQSGFLLFDAPQGLVRVDPSFWQRLYLLWTFRNFRQLSTRLLNSRQCALVNTLFRDGAGAVSHSHDQLLVIGVVEDYMPPIARAAVAPAPTNERREEALVARAEIASQATPVSSSSPLAVWSKLGTTLGVLSLCAISAVAWHRLQGIPGSQAHNQPRLQLINATTSPNSPTSARPVAVAQSPTTSALPAAALPLVPKAAVKATSIAAGAPAPKQPPRMRAAASAANLSLSSQDSRILASRPPLRFVYPAYPDVPTRGVVALTAQLDSEGSVRAVKIISGNRALAAAAVRAVRQWRYRPYLKDGQPVPTETNIVISFISEDAISMSFPPSIPASR